MTLEKTDVVTEEHWIPVLLSDKAQHFKNKIKSLHFVVLQHVGRAAVVVLLHVAHVR